MTVLKKRLISLIMTLEAEQKDTTDFNEEKLINHAIYANKMLLAYIKRKEKNYGNSK